MDFSIPRPSVNLEMMKVLLLFCLTGALSAQVLRVDQAFGGMECASCADFIKKKLENKPGVKSVEVDTKKGVVSVLLDPDNNVKPQLIRDWVQQSGYQTKDTTIHAIGVVDVNRGVMTLKIDGKDMFTLLDHEFLLRESIKRKLEVTGVLEKAKLAGADIEALSIKSTKPAK